MITKRFSDHGLQRAIQWGRGSDVYSVKDHILQANWITLSAACSKSSS